MSNRCPDCNKFVSLEMGEVELDFSKPEYMITARLPRLCSECGGEMAKANFELDFPLEDNCCDDPARTWESEPEAKITERTQETHRKGNQRYMKQFYGVEVTASVKCTHCGQVQEVSVADECQASAFDELV